MNPDTTPRQLVVSLARDSGWLAYEFESLAVVMLSRGDVTIVAAFDEYANFLEARRVVPHSRRAWVAHRITTFEEWLQPQQQTQLAPLPVESPAQIVDFEHLRTFARFLVGGFPPGGTVKASEVGRMIQRFVDPQPEIQS